ncbi:MAG TPA: hypothetical protein VHV83_10400, partial [Armatimonadota bacterium]|nr:hypothetical protein [Armatimonadota bacterium]
VTGLVRYKLLDFSAHKSSASTREMNYDSYYRDRDHDNGCGPDMNRGKSQWHKHQGQYKNRDKHDGGHKR